MSMSALLTAVQNRLCDKLGYVKHRNIEIVPRPGRPTNIAGELFVSIWGVKLTKYHNRALDERFDVRVTVSMRGGRVAWDRWGEGLWLEATRGLEPHVRAIVAQIHGAGQNGIELLTAANQLIEGESNKFLTGHPLVFTGELGPDPKSSAWWGKAAESWAGISSTLQFDGAQRIQKVDQIV